MVAAVPPGWRPALWATPAAVGQGAEGGRGKGEGWVPPRAAVVRAPAGWGMDLGVMERGGLTPGAAFEQCPPPCLAALPLSSSPQSCPGPSYLPTGSK